MRLSARVLSAVLFAMAMGTPQFVQADNWFTDFWGGVAQGTHRNNAWPEPFNYQDRQAVSAHFGAAINKGWEHQNLLSDHHFEDGSSAVTQAGQLKMRWILTQAPQNQRVLFVQKGLNANQTQARLELVQQVAAGILPPGESPVVAVSNLDATGWSAETIVAVGRKFQASTPEPRLPKEGGGSSGGGASGGGASDGK